MIRTAVFGLALAAFAAGGASAAEIVMHDAKSSPESLSVAPDGSVIAGSAGSPFIYRAKKGATTAETFVDASAEGAGTFFLGVLSDPSTSTVWACQLTPVTGGAPGARKSVLRGFDMAGKEKLRWTFPGDNALCNDFSVGPDKALYISDTTASKIYRLAPGAKDATLFMDNPRLNGVDGITFLGGVLYVNNVIFNKIYRIPVDAEGKAGAPVDIWTDAPIKGPDGMRAMNGKLLLAENGAGKIDALTITGDIAHVTVLKEGLATPTAVEPAGDAIWVNERNTGKVMSLPAPK